MTAEKEALQKELDKYRMELTLHRMTEMQRAAIEEAEAEQKANEEAKRLSLKDAFLARNREELLTLVNPWHELSEAYEPHLTEIGDGMLFDERAAGALKHMLEDAKAAAFDLCVSKGIDPFMTLSFMALPVIPTLRLTTRGVFDVTNQRYV